MKHIVRKAFFDYEKEENWLNEMSMKGLHLSDYSWCKYTFEDGAEGEYIYRIELLDNLAYHPVSQKYLQFLEENTVEHVASYMRWVYLRKKASEGKFEVYTDIESRIKYYKKVNNFWLTLALAEISIGISNISIANINRAVESAVNASSLNWILGSLCMLLGIVFVLVSMPLRRKIRRLKREAKLHQ